jgi:hypothetical protein
LQKIKVLPQQGTVERSEEVADIAMVTLNLETAVSRGIYLPCSVSAGGGWMQQQEEARSVER